MDMVKTREVGYGRVLALWKVAAILAFTAAAALLAGQPIEAQRSVRIVIPEAMPAFDPDVGERHPGAVAPRAIIFPHEPGDEHTSVILLNPRHVDIGTLETSLSRLMRSVETGQTQLIVVTDGMVRRGRWRADTGAVARVFARLKAAPRSDVPRLGYGVMIMTQWPPAGRGGDAW